MAASCASTGIPSSSSGPGTSAGSSSSASAACVDSGKSHNCFGCNHGSIESGLAHLLCHILEFVIVRNVVAGVCIFLRRLKKMEEKQIFC